MLIDYYLLNLVLTNKNNLLSKNHLSCCIMVVWVLDYMIGDIFLYFGVWCLMFMMFCTFLDRGFNYKELSSSYRRFNPYASYVLIDRSFAYFECSVYFNETHSSIDNSFKSRKSHR